MPTSTKTLPLRGFDELNLIIPGFSFEGKQFRKGRGGKVDFLMLVDSDRVWFALASFPRGQIDGLKISINNVPVWGEH